MEPIDIVVTYLNPRDEKWQKDYEYYKNQEIGSKIHKSTERQAFGVERAREWDNFRFWFRGVEQNCPWVNKVFLVVQNERHVPQWLDRNNPKLRIVYHDEFMPKELLPTFNGMAIQFYVSLIPDLSENYIYSDDDMFFLNPTPQEYFFNEDGPVLDVRTEKYCLRYDTEWQRILNTNRNFLHKLIPNENIQFKDSHLPDPCSKRVESKIIMDNYEEFLNSFKDSKFRRCGNYQRFLLVDIPKIGHETCVVDRIKNSKYVQYNSRSNLNDCVSSKLICINDTENMDNFEMCKERLFKFLKFKLPTKSSFELYDLKESINSGARCIKPCFGIVSWLPDNEISRQQRIERLDNTFKQLYDLFGDDANFLVIAQNWKDYIPPAYIKNICIEKRPKLGILNARKTLRDVFLKSKYDYLIMCDDDIILNIDKNFTKEYFLEELNKHPDGFMFLKYGWSLNFHAISKYILSREAFVDIDPEKEEGYEDTVWPWLLHYKYPKKEFHVFGIKFEQNEVKYHKNHASTWDNKNVNHNLLRAYSDFYVSQFKKGNFKIDKKEANNIIRKLQWYEKAIFQQWCTREEYDEFKKKYGL